MCLNILQRTRCGGAGYVFKHTATNVFKQGVGERDMCLNILQRTRCGGAGYVFKHTATNKVWGSGICV